MYNEFFSSVYFVHLQHLVEVVVDLDVFWIPARHMFVAKRIFPAGDLWEILSFLIISGNWRRSGDWKKWRKLDMLCFFVKLFYLLSP